MWFELAARSWWLWNRHYRKVFFSLLSTDSGDVLRHKYRQGLATFLAFVFLASEDLGGGEEAPFRAKVPPLSFHWTISLMTWNRETWNGKLVSFSLRWKVLPWASVVKGSKLIWEKRERRRFRVISDDASAREKLFEKLLEISDTGWPPPNKIIKKFLKTLFACESSRVRSCLKCFEDIWYTAD